MAVDLVFRSAPLTGPSIDLVFGAGDDGGPVDIPPVTASADSALPGLGAAGPFATGSTATGDSLLPALAPAGPFAYGTTASGDTRLPGLVATGRALYDTATERPTVASVSARWQEAVPIEVGPAVRWNEGASVQVAVRVVGQEGLPVRAGTAVGWQEGVGLRVSRLTRFQDAVAVRVTRGVDWQEGVPVRVGRTTRMQDGVPVRLQRTTRFQDGIRRRRGALARFQEAQPVAVSVLQHGAAGVRVELGWQADFQEGIRPPPGRWVRPGPPAPEPCYVPPPGHAVPLLFAEAWTGSANLLFVCERHVEPPAPPHYVIPLLRVYMAVHDIEAVLLPSLETVVLTDGTLSTGDGDPVWTLSANGPEHLLDQLRAVDGVSPLVRITVDGNVFVFSDLVVTRTRSFGDRSAQVSGRSQAALLGAPTMDPRTWLNSSDRTAQQLVADALDLTGFGIDWQITDWLVPAGAWSFQGTPLEVAARVAEAAGAILQSDPAEALLRFLPRYPLMPWEWMLPGNAADVQVASAAIVTDSYTPKNAPAYEAVYVGGTTQGVLGHVTRAGTAGAILAAQVTDNLITHADAARQRGRAILGAGGRQVGMGLTLPLLTGGDLPGLLQMNQLLEVVEPSETWRGMVRSVSLSFDSPTVRQSFNIERHLP